MIVNESLTRVFRRLPNVGRINGSKELFVLCIVSYNNSKRWIIKTNGGRDANTRRTGAAYERRARSFRFVGIIVLYLFIRTIIKSTARHNCQGHNND